MGNLTSNVMKTCRDDSDWMINFSEYVFIRTLATIPKHRFRLALNMMDLDRSGYIDSWELREVINVFKPASMNEEEFYKTMSKSSLYQDLLGTAGKISIDRMYEFLEKLRESLLKMEFECYDNKQSGFISSQDFARILVSYVHPKDARDYMKKVETCPDVGLVSLEQYIEFNEAIHQLDTILDGLAFYFTVESHTTSDILQRAFFAGAGVWLPGSMMDIIMHVFDRDENGTLELNELSAVLGRKQKMSKAKLKDVNFAQTWRCAKMCFQNGP